jgi:cellulose synthase/poly-beta-1,6-N-acetylglucosamine synthase-like glycosyltransferase
MRRDGLPEPTMLDVSGISGPPEPACRARRAALLADAPPVSVVISTRDRASVLEACLESILACDYPAFDVIVVDNAPSDDTTRRLVERLARNHANLTYLLEERPGKSLAYNRAFAQSTAEIMALTDDDVVVDRAWISALAAGFAVSERVACVTGLVLPLELTTPAQSWFEQFGGFSKGFETRIFDLGEHRSGHPLYPFALGMLGTGANMAVRRRAIQAIGGFETALGPGTPALGGEDLALLLDVLASGSKIVYQPDALVWHRHRREYAALRRQVYGYGVSLGACFTRSLLVHPRLVPPFLARLPRGVRYLLSPRSEKNASKGHDFPRELTRLERRGLLRGPRAYLAGRHARPR